MSMYVCVYICIYLCVCVCACVHACERGRAHNSIFQHQAAECLFTSSVQEMAMQNAALLYGEGGNVEDMALVFQLLAGCTSCNSSCR